jgi:SAM-dependent methyltransferase
LGLDLKFLNNLYEFASKGWVRPGQNVIEIGAQQLANNFLEAAESLDALYALFGRKRPVLGSPKSDIRAMAHSAPSSRLFWESLGFSHFTIDFEGHKNSTALDLNCDSVATSMRGRFDLVVNCGTTEHVVNQANAFAVIHDLAKPGAIMYHDVPVCTFGHGMVNYTPKFFLQLFRQNYQPLFIRVEAWTEREVPRYVRAMNRKWGKGHSIGFDAVMDLTISAALRKVRDQPFTTPLDVHRSIMMRQYAHPRRWKHLIPLR